MDCKHTPNWSTVHVADSEETDRGVKVWLAVECKRCMEDGLMFFEEGDLPEIDWEEEDDDISVDTDSET